jgi:hypothetical protein
MSTSPALPTSPGRPTACDALTAAGAPCRFPPRLGATRCINHDPVYRQRQEQNRRAGVRNAATARAHRARLRVDTALYSIDEWALADRASIQALLDAVIRLELAGRLPNARARNLIRALGLAIRNFDTPPKERHKPQAARHNLTRYYHTRRSLDNHLDELCAEAETRDAARRNGMSPGAPTPSTVLFPPVTDP